MPVRYRVSLGVAFALMLLSSVGLLPEAASQDRAPVPREEWSRVEDVLTALGVAAGSQVADVGAGHGFFTRRLSTAVGSTGRVYAVDVNPISLRELKQGLGDDHPNVEIVRGEENDPRLPANTLDAALIVNAYHEFAEYRAMLARLGEALKPGGRLVLIEPIPTRAEDTSRAAQTRRHSIAIEFAEQDLRDAGFEVVRRDAAFIVRAHRHDGEEPQGPRPTDWLLVAVKPQGLSGDLACLDHADQR